MRTGAIIVAGGRGARAGGEQPKQLAPLGGKPVLSWSLSAFDSHPDIAALCVVAPDAAFSEYKTLCPAPIYLTVGGATRTDSVRAGLAALADADLTHVLVHDAARPGLDRDMISSLIAGLETADAIAPALPVADALKRRDGGKTTTVDRENLYRVQTPQGFQYGMLYKALENHTDHFVDDLEAVEALGAHVTLIAGSEHLSKITYPEDFHRMSTLLAPKTSTTRMGTGFDVHKFSDGDHVSLCGVKIPHDQGLAGHSDADVAWHALTDAILGALALGDIGDHFPPSDPQWKDADSQIFLTHAVKLATERGYEIANCDLTVICEAPKVKPHRQAMRACTADCLGIDVDRVSVKATTTEGLGFTGRGEGIAAQAAATLSLKT